MNEDEKEGSKIGIPYYAEADWQIQCHNSVDDSGFSSYEEMRKHTEKLKEQIQAKGHNVVDVKINASEMQDYFDRKGLANNGTNRSAYVADKLRRENL